MRNFFEAVAYLVCGGLWFVIGMMFVAVGGM